MIVREALTWAVFIGILCTVRADGDRWSRQIANSEWIPLADPRISQRVQSVAPAVEAAAPAVATDSSAQAAGQVPALTLPPALQQQYQEQLVQLQKTQESIQRLLLLQQQLKAQQQLLQSQAYQPNSFANAEDDKQALHQSTIVNLQTLPELAPEVLVPPVPSSEALPPVFRSQNFHPETELKRDHGHRSQQQNSQPASSEQDYRQTHEESIPPPRASRPREDGEKDYRPKQKSRYETGAQRHKEEPSHANFVTPATSVVLRDGSDEQEEVQLVYVPAETLAQRGHGNKLHKSQPRKHHSNRHHQQQHHGQSASTALPSHDAYAREILQQLQRQHEEKNQYLNLERQKEIARLHAEQKELDRQARLHQEAVRKEQELMRQREAEKKRKELEKIEEAARQRELQRIQEIREQERLEQKKLAELKAKEEEERRKELERFATYEREKELKRQKEYEQSREHEVRTRPEHGFADVQQTQSYEDQPDAQPLVQDTQLHHQHLTEVTHKSNKPSRHRNKPRKQQHHFHQQQQQQPEYHDSAESQSTTPSPNQPPLSVYMGSSLADHNRVQLSDVLKTLKNARTIAVLDSFGPETPRVFVGPRNLDPPAGYAKFDLPYLSSIENNRVERKVDRLPFFVAPLSFEPPPGYSKIPFPAPHIGSVVINNLENVEIKPHEHQNLHPTPLIEPNSYVVSNQPLSAYDVSTPVSYPQESSTPRYEVSSLPASQSSTKWRFDSFFENKPSTEIPSAVTAASYHEERTPTSKFERPSKNRNYYNPNEVSTTPNYFSPKTVSAFSFEQTAPQSTPAYHEEEPPRHHNVDSHLVDQNVGHHRQTHPRFPDPEPERETSHHRFPDPEPQREITHHRFTDPEPQRETSPHRFPDPEPQRETSHHRFPEPESQREPARQRFPVDPNGHSVTSTYFSNPSNYEDPAQYNLPAELPAISPQLPGLVNALVDKPDIPIPSTIHPPAPSTTTPTTTTTTTTTTETPTTTYRPRSRQRSRVSAPRATTLSPPSRGHSERATRRPVNRSKSKYTTTTEEYNDSSYDPTRRNSVTTSRYDDQDSHSRRPTARSHYKPRDEETKESIQTQIVDSNAPSEQGQRGVGSSSGNSYENVPLIDSAPPASGGTPTADLNIPVYQQDDYSASTASSVDNFSSHRDSTGSISDSILPLSGLEYTRKSTFAPSYSSSSPSYDHVDEQPVNGFNYRTHETHTTRDYPYFRPGKTESVLFEPIPTTDLPNVQRSQLQDFSPVYHSFDSGETPRPVYRESTGSNSGSSSSEEESPIFLPISHDKQEEYSYQTTATEAPETTTTTTTTTTETPVVTRQRVRGRLGGRTTDSAIQTRPRGSQDEYVRFSAVNQDSGSRSNGRQRARPRTRAQPSGNSPIQTEGQEYVRIQGSGARRQPTTSTTARPAIEEQPKEDEEDYGFIRQPNYRPAQQTNYKTTQAQITEIPETTTAESSQSQILKNRAKYLSATRRPASSTRATTTPRSDDTAYTVRPRSRVSGSSQTDAAKPTKARGRLRRPGARRRVTTTTEAALEANELPLDENYPRIHPGQVQQDAARRGEDLADENYPQEFLLNYGASQGYRSRDDQYEERRRNNNRPTTSRSSSSDIYGAESQWSTKLTGNSFQPSSYTPNQPIGETKESESQGQEKAGDLPEIITAGPDVPSITVLVSSDDDKPEQKKEQEKKQEEPKSSSEETMMGSMMESMIDFGKKMGVTEMSDDAAITTTTTAPESPTSTETTPEVNRANTATFKKAGLRRRRVRVRVRPAGASAEDFVTAESQSYDSSLNNLPREANKFRNFFVVTAKPTTITASATTTTTTTTTEPPKTEKSVFESFLDKMLGEDEVPTTVAPEVVTSPQEDEDSWTDVSTIVPAQEVTTLSPTTQKNEEPVGNTELPTTVIDTTTTTTTTTQKSTEEVKNNNSGENVIQTLNQENSLRYFVTKSPAFSEYLRSQEKSKLSEDSPDHPKNHRSKWSEVRYPSDKSLFEFAKWNTKNLTEDKSAQPQQQQQPTASSSEADNSSVTDYVKAIFESIKSADEEHHQSAKLAEQATTPPPPEVKTSVSTSSRVSYSRSQSSSGPGTTTTTTQEPATLSPFVPSMMSSGPVKKTSLETNLGKILRTTTTTKVSHMTEICYRGRCVMSKPKKDGVSR